MGKLLHAVKHYADFEFSVNKLKIPSVKDYTGKNRWNEFDRNLKVYMLKVKEKENLLAAGSKEFGEDVFLKAVDEERGEIGRKYFGFNQDI